MVEEVCHGETQKVLLGVQTRSGGFGQRSGGDKEPDCPGTGYQREPAGTLRSRVEGGRPLSRRAQANERLLDRIEQIHRQSDGVMGSPRIWEELHWEGQRCSLNRVARLMRPARPAGNSTTQALAKQALRQAAWRDSQSPVPGLQCQRTGHQMGGRHHLCEKRRRAGCIYVWWWICTPGLWWVGR